MSLIDDNDRHQIYLGKLTSHLLKTSLYPSLTEAYRAAADIIERAGDDGSFRLINRIQKDLKRTIEPILIEGTDKLTVGLMDMAEYEAEHAAKLFGSYAGEALNVPSNKKIARHIDKSLMTLSSGASVQTGVWADYVQRNIDGVYREYNGIIAAGYRDGLTVGQMKRQLMATTNDMLAYRAEALARTGQNHYSNNAREAMAAENSDVIKYRVFVATFDISTTNQCRGNHGKSWEIEDTNYPKLPLHFNERSVYVYVNDVDDAFKGTRSAVGGKKADKIDPERKLKYKGRADKDIFDPGQISARTDQTAWFKKQPIWWQDEAVGKTRAKLVRDGGMKFDRFTDMLGKDIPLSRLKELDAAAFKKAGL